MEKGRIPTTVPYLPSSPLPCAFRHVPSSDFSRQARREGALSPKARGIEGGAPRTKSCIVRHRGSRAPVLGPSEMVRDATYLWNGSRDLDLRSSKSMRSMCDRIDRLEIIHLLPSECGCGWRTRKITSRSKRTQFAPLSMSQERQIRSVLYDNTVCLRLSTDNHTWLQAFVRVYHSIAVVSKGSEIGNAVESRETKGLLSNLVPLGTHSYVVLPNAYRKILLVTLSSSHRTRTRHFLRLKIAAHGWIANSLNSHKNAT